MEQESFRLIAENNTTYCYADDDDNDEQDYDEEEDDDDRWQDQTGVFHVDGLK